MSSNHMGLRIILARIELNRAKRVRLLTFIKNNPIPDYIIKWAPLFIMISNKSMISCQDDINIVNSRYHIFSSLTVVFYGFEPSIQVTIIIFRSVQSSVPEKVDFYLHLYFFYPLVDQN